MSRASALCVMPSCFRSALTTAVSILRRFMLVPSVLHCPSFFMSGAIPWLGLPEDCRYTPVELTTPRGTNIVLTVDMDGFHKANEFPPKVLNRATERAGFMGFPFCSRLLSGEPQRHWGVAALPSFWKRPKIQGVKKVSAGNFSIVFKMPSRERQAKKSPVGMS